eukprot:g20613.t1
MGRCCTFGSCRGRYRRVVGAGGIGSEGRVDQSVLEGTVPVEGVQGKGGEYVSGGDISLEVAEMVSDDLDVDAGGMVGKDKENPFTFAVEKRGVKVKVQEMGWTRLRTLSTTVLGNPQLRKK